MKSKKTRIPKKDIYVLILGFSLAFLAQMAYDVAHEFAFLETLNYGWISIQVVFVVFFVTLVCVAIRQVNQEI